jgi:hypothetical protein
MLGAEIENLRHRAEAGDVWAMRECATWLLIGAMVRIAAGLGRPDDMVAMAVAWVFRAAQSGDRTASDWLPEIGESISPDSWEAAKATVQDMEIRSLQ